MVLRPVSSTSIVRCAIGYRAVVWMEFVSWATLHLPPISVLSPSGRSVECCGDCRAKRVVLWAESRRSSSPRCRG